MMNHINIQKAHHLQAAEMRALATKLGTLENLAEPRNVVLKNIVIICTSVYPSIICHIHPNFLF